MGMEEQWNALCLTCEEEEMSYIMHVYVNDYLYQCPKCKLVKVVTFGEGEGIVAKMKDLGIKIQKL